MDSMSLDAVGGVPHSRLRITTNAAIRPDGAFVVYWMTGARRLRWNFALDRAVGWAKELKRPLVIVEVLTCGGRWDTQRHHRFVLDGMNDNARDAADSPAIYYPYVERQPGNADGLLAALGEQACVLVTDDFPIGRSVFEAASPPCPARVESVDGNGLLPMRAAEKAYSTAHAFRRFLQRALADHLLDAPKANPLGRLELPRLESLPPTILGRWPAATDRMLRGETPALKMLSIDHQVAVAPAVGGPAAAVARWKTFLTKKLTGYTENRNRPEADATSGLSPYLHFGHISVHQILHDLARQEQWSPDRLAETGNGSRDGWWGMSEPAEAFLDQLVTWRELGFNACTFQADYDTYESLPPWAKTTLAKHARDIRDHVYSLDEFAAAKTHDPLWNAAQQQLVTEGHIHNYLRMLWGKKILEWSASPEEALNVMIELNNRYALDGQDPNSYSGIFWVLGRYDRPWGPERPIYGTVRYMSSENAARKFRLRQYIERYNSHAPVAGTPRVP
jgi:deoxyribodipyrimidine photo-lyase